MNKFRTFAAATAIAASLTGAGAALATPAFAATGDETSSSCSAKAEELGGRGYVNATGGCNFYATVKGPISFDAESGEVSSRQASSVTSQGLGEARGSRGSTVFKPGTCAQKTWEASSTDGNTDAGAVDRAKSPCD